jgi:hypothetical protein
MKLEKIQIEILKAVLKDPMRVNCHETPDGTGWLITTNNYVVYNIPVELLRVNLNHCQRSMGLLDLFERTDETYLNKPLTPTDHYRRGGTAQCFLYNDRKDCPIYVDAKLLAVFDSPELHMIGDYNPKGLLAVVEYQMEDDPTIVGILCPVNIKED